MRTYNAIAHDTEEHGPIVEMVEDTRGDYVDADLAFDMLDALKAAFAVLVQDDTPIIYAQVRRAIDKAEGRA